MTDDSTGPRRGPTTARTATPRRLMLRIPPAADADVMQWWGEQDSPSASVLELIRGAIERHGFTDLRYQPVRQLPRRGRPPLSEVDSRPADEYDGAEEAATAPHAASADRPAGTEVHEPKETIPRPQSTSRAGGYFAGLGIE